MTGALFLKKKIHNPQTNKTFFPEFAISVKKRQQAKNTCSSVPLIYAHARKGCAFEVGVSLLFVRTAVTLGSVQGTVLRTHTLHYAFSAPKTVIIQAGNVI